MDGRRNNGGKRKGAGRKPKATEQQIIARLDNIIESDDAIRALKELINKLDFNAIKLYFEYRFGRPKNSVDITSGDEPLKNFNLSNLSDTELSVILKLHDGQDFDPLAE